MTRGRGRGRDVGHLASRRGHTGSLTHVFGTTDQLCRGWLLGGPKLGCASFPRSTTCAAPQLGGAPHIALGPALSARQQGVHGLAQSGFVLRALQRIAGPMAPD